MNFKWTVLTSAKRTHLQTVLSCVYEVGWLVQLVTIFWPVTAFYKSLKIHVCICYPQAIAALNSLVNSLPKVWYSQSWLLFSIISQAFMPYLFECLLFILLVKNPNKTDKLFSVCSVCMWLLSRFSVSSRSLHPSFQLTWLHLLFRIKTKRHHSPCHTQTGSFIT